MDSLLPLTYMQLNALTIKRIIGATVLLIVFLFLVSLFLSSLNTARKKSGVSTIGFGGVGVGYAPNEDRVAEQAGISQVTRKKVIRHGSLSLLVERAEDAVESIRGLAERLEGFVQDARVYETTGNTKNGTITIRVPETKFNEALSEIKRLAVSVENETLATEDVSDQFVDLEARLKNFKAEEGQYQKIMERATDITDILSVARELSRVRGDVERLEGQLLYLSRQVEMSTITVTLASEADVEVFGLKWRPLTIAKQSFRNMLSGLTGSVDTLIGILLYLPIILFWLIVIGIGVFIGSRLVGWIQKKFLSRVP